MLLIVPEMQITYFRLLEQIHYVDELKGFMNDDDNIEGDFTELNNYDADHENNDKPKYNLDMNASHIERIDNEKWPQTGEIEMNTVNIRYEKIEERALNNVSFKLKNMEKLAIIGRSLSGKTTLLNALLRNIRVEVDDNNKTLGNIFIDGKNIESINLNKLRRNVFIIPQNPVLLNGNLIFNIDPLMQYKDEEILSAIKKTKLYEYILENIQNKQANMPPKDKYRIEKNEIPKINLNYSKRIDYLSKLNQEVKRTMTQIPLFVQNDSSEKVISTNKLPSVKSHPLENQPRTNFIKEKPQEITTQDLRSYQTITKLTEEFNMHSQNVVESTQNMNTEEKQFEKRIIEFKIENYGENLSVKERQLIYLARAILNKPKILLIDELAFEFDDENFTHIDSIIKNEFREVTIIRNLQNLRNVHFYDKIIMLDNGEVVEEGAPMELLHDKGSLLLKLTEEFKNDFECMNIGDCSDKRFMAY